MPESLVIINTSPLLYLHQTANLDLLQKLYGTIAVPLAVQQEQAKQAGYVSSVAAAIKMLQAKGMWLSDPIIREVLRLSDELVE